MSVSRPDCKSVKENIIGVLFAQKCRGKAKVESHDWETPKASKETFYTVVYGTAIFLSYPKRQKTQFHEFCRRLFFLRAVLSKHVHENYHNQIYADLLCLPGKPSEE